MSLKDWLEKTSEQEVKELKSLSEEELNDRFFQKLDFGTAGMRGVLGIGENRMNIYQIRRVCIAYSKWLVTNFKNPSVAISYDNRRMSNVFSKEAAEIFSSFGIKTYLSSELRPTPYLSYAVRELNCTGGVMITASHNPKDNNGIKLYDETGAQYTPSVIASIIDLVNQTDYFEEKKSANPDLILDYINLLDEKYVSDILSIRLNNELDLSKVDAVFTPLHGATSTLIEKIIPSIRCTKEQMVNDSEFSTLNLPNPETPDVFDLSLNYATDLTDIMLATDPDGDRLGVMVKHQGEFVFLSGNEISVLILNYLLENSKDLNKNKVVFKSVVTGTLGDKLVEKYGLTMKHILTGFKYVGEGINKLEANQEFFFGYEESNGCLVKEFVRDKDSLQASLILVEAVAYYKTLDKTLIDVLNSLHEEFKYHLNKTLSYGFSGETGLKKMADFVNYFRSVEMNNLVKRIDFMDQNEYDLTDMVYLETNDAIVIVRPSGTEPKIKVYLEIVADSKDEANVSLKAYQELIEKVIEKL